ncbi:MAG TPA: hypothetical protein VFP89_11400 [Propionibacteriaceae bacterium]|nr:hypothetical protein [Propionibacteriaceae bacterium]
MTNQPHDHGVRPPVTSDLPLIIEQLQDQLDQLRATAEAQQAVLEQHAARLAALERR